MIGYRGYSGEDEYTGDVNKDLEGTKKLKDLLADVPHMSHEAAIASSTLPSLTEELSKPFDDEYPAHFLSPDDVDNYIHVIDARLDPDSHVPTMAPIAHPGHPPPLHPLLRNPNSSTSWLRRHAPHIFLQGHDNSSATVAGAEALERASAHANDDDEGASTVGASAPSGNSSSRKSRPSGAAGRDKASAKEKNSTPATAKASKRASTAAAADDDTDTNATPAPKGKRKRDEDAGYRPKGGSSSRPSKKKRKSETGASGTEGTPTVKRAKKEAAAANGDD